MGEQQMPITLSYWRWQVAVLLLLPFVIQPLWRERQVIRENLFSLFVLALLSVTSFNTLAYIGLQTTSATNGALMNSLIPIYVLLITAVAFRQTPNARQGLGMVLSFLGVLSIISKLDGTLLSELRFAQGDFWLLAATFIWALYSVLLKTLRPNGLSGISFLGITALMGTLPLLLLYIIDPFNEATPVLNTEFSLIILYVAIFPSILAYLAWNYGLKVMGPNIGSQFVHFMPVFGAVLAYFILDEAIHLYHVVGAVLIAAGLILSVRSRER